MKEDYYETLGLSKSATRRRNKKGLQKDGDQIPS
jgi:DnaJ-class molecular chaperone